MPSHAATTPSGTLFVQVAKINKASVPTATGHTGPFRKLQIQSMDGVFIQLPYCSVGACRWADTRRLRGVCRSVSAVRPIGTIGSR